MRPHHLICVVMSIVCLAGLYVVLTIHIYFALGMKQLLVHVFLIVTLSASVVSSLGQYPNCDDNSLHCRGNEYHLFLSL